MRPDSVSAAGNAVALSPVDLASAIGIANRLADAAVWAGDLCAFHGACAAESISAPPLYRSLEGDLYEGSAGIARFLAVMARITRDDRLRRTALGAIAHSTVRTSGWSMFSGRTGAGLVALEVAGVLDDPTLVPAGLEAIEQGSEEALAAADHGPFDLLAGVAGVVQVLVAAMEYDLDGGWRRRAHALGRSLIAAARRTETGWSWPLLPGHQDHLCGLAHGAAGIALALSQLGAVFPDEPDWPAAAAQARAFEQQWYSPAHGSWADLRSEGRVAGSSFGYPHFWCHGSVGIGHDRIAAMTLNRSGPLDHADAVAALAGARAAAERILAGPAGPGAPFEANGSQCHGLGGLIDLVIEAWRVDEDPTLIILSRSLTAFMRNDAGLKQQWRCGVPGGGQTPGLMLGLAGIGWAHLRAWNPEAIPSAWAPRPGSIRIDRFVKQSS
jgi:lantibiotic biosynthesis protein